MARSTNAKEQPAQQAVRGFIPPQNDAERFFMRHIEDLVRLAEKRGIVRYSDFLSDREQLLAKAAIPKGTQSSVCFEGGMSNAERKVLCILPYDEKPEPPIACVRMQPKQISGAAMPRHKDYLGSLMALSFERACIGDIFLPDPRSGIAYVFMLQSVLPVVLQEVASIGRVNVTVEEILAEELPSFAQNARVIQSTTVPSLRLDAVLSAMLRCSRGQAADYISAGSVEINHVPVASVHASVYAQDIFTIRGKGRFQLVSLQGKSKKDRFIIEYFQF